MDEPLDSPGDYGEVHLVFRHREPSRKTMLCVPYGLPELVQVRPDTPDKISFDLRLENEKYFLQITRIEPETIWLGSHSITWPGCLKHALPSLTTGLSLERMCIHTIKGMQWLAITLHCGTQRFDERTLADLGATGIGQS